MGLRSWVRKVQCTMKTSSKTLFSKIKENLISHDMPPSINSSAAIHSQLRHPHAILHFTVYGLTDNRRSTHSEMGLYNVLYWVPFHQGQWGHIHIKPKAHSKDTHYIEYTTILTALWSWRIGQSTSQAKSIVLRES